MVMESKWSVFRYCKKWRGELKDSIIVNYICSTYYYLLFNCEHTKLELYKKICQKNFFNFGTNFNLGM